MNKFCVLGLSMLLCLVGCKDSEKKPLKEQSPHSSFFLHKLNLLDEEKPLKEHSPHSSFFLHKLNLLDEEKPLKEQNPHSSPLRGLNWLDEKRPLKEQSPHPYHEKTGDELMDYAKSWRLTTLETLGLTLDSTTRSEAIDILNSRGYTVALFKQGILEEVDLAGLSQKWLEKWFVKGLPSNELLGDGIKSFHDRLKKSSVVMAGNLNFQGRWDNLSVSDDFEKDLMLFIFDKNKKLIMFFKQYPENKEAELVVYEGIKGSGISNMGEKKPTIIFRKDRSFAIIRKKDSKEMSYLIFAPSIVGKHVDALNKAGKSMINSKEFKELQKKENEYLKDFEGLPSKEYRKKREELRNSKEYKELRKKMEEKTRHEYLKNLNELSAK